MARFWNVLGRLFEILFEEMRLRRRTTLRSRDLSGSLRSPRGCEIMELPLI
jgi:hypothetical protein